MFYKLKIAPKLILFLLMGCTLVLIAMSSVNYTVGKDLMYEDMVAQTTYMVSNTANSIDTVQNGISKVVLYASSNYKPNYSDSQIKAMLSNIIKYNPEVQGSCFAYPPDIKESTIYGYRKESKIIFAENNLDYLTSDWFTLPRDTESPIWTDPYYDFGGSEMLMVTYSVPIYAENSNRLLGVITADVALDWISSMLTNLNESDSGYNFLISNQGTIISHPKKDWVMNESIFSIADSKGLPLLREHGKNMIDGVRDFGYYGYSDVNKSNSHIAYAPIKSTGWSVANVVSDNELFSGIFLLNKFVIFVGFSGFLLLMIILYLIATSITKPITQLEAAAREFANGNLECERMSMPKGENEITSLINEFYKMKDNILEQINVIKKTTAEKERIERELDIAASIQQSLIPKNFEEFNEDNIFSIYGVLNPARAVGGDLYDFFKLSDNKVGLMIGDVSDKGVPAALFMSVVSTVTKVLWNEGMSPSEALTLVNKEITRSNNTNMFVTLLFGIIDLAEATFTYSIAGHPAPYIISRNNSVVQVQQIKGAVAGVFDFKKYSENTVKLNDGDVIFMFTDGVDECMNADNQLFGQKRLASNLAEIGTMAPNIIVEQLVSVLKEHAGGAQQSDDITILCFRFEGKKV